MSNRFLVIALLLSLVLAACGRGGEVVEEARATAEGVAQGVSETAGDAISTVTGGGSETAALCDPADIPQSTQADVTVRFVNNTDGQVAIIWRDVDQSPPALTEYTVLAAGESYDQETFVGHEWIAEDQAGNGVVEYTATSDATQCLVIEADALVMVPTEEPAGEIFEVDPTQPIDVEDSSSTQISIDANELVDENGNPATGEVTVNMYTPDSADEGAGSEAETSTSCEQPDTSNQLTVWSYNPETGLWEEEGPAMIQDERCVASAGTVSVEVTDDQGGEYELAEGAKAEVSIPCEPTPDEVLTVWSYNPETGLWEEEDTIVVQEGERCIAEVSDLSNVNFAATAAEPVSGIQGQVVDLDSGEPLAGAQVCVQGTDQCATVDDNGNYSLSDLDPAEQVFEVTALGYIMAMQTITLTPSETLAQDFALTALEVAEGESVLWVDAQSNPLRESVIVAGLILDDQSVTQTEGQVLLSEDFVFNYYSNGQYLEDHPLIGVKAGDSSPIIVINIASTSLDDVFIPIAQTSETELGSAAVQNLLSNTYTLVNVGDVNEPVKEGDLVQVALKDANSSEAPYYLSIYRGEKRELVAEFELVKK